MITVTHWVILGLAAVLAISVICAFISDRSETPKQQSRDRGGYLRIVPPQHEEDHDDAA